MFYISYKMLLRHLRRGMDGVLNDSVGEVLLPHPPLPFCSILPTYEKTSENPSLLSLLTFHAFAELSVCRSAPDVCCSYMTSSCKYALFSFLNRTEKNHTGTQLTNKFLIESGASWHSEPTCPTLRVPTCPVATFLCFRLHHPQTQWKSTVLFSFNVSQKEVPLMGGTMLHVAVTKL
jgi:hypothetical protein